MTDHYRQRIKTCKDSELAVFISVMEKHVPELQSRLAIARREQKSRAKPKKVKP